LVKDAEFWQNELIHRLVRLDKLQTEKTTRIPPSITFLVVGLFFYLSKRELEMEKAIKL
jgi:hypothetical protein